MPVLQPKELWEKRPAIACRYQQTFTEEWRHRIEIALSERESHRSSERDCIGNSR